MILRHDGIVSGFEELLSCVRRADAISPSPLSEMNYSHCPMRGLSAFRSITFGPESSDCRSKVGFQIGSQPLPNLVGSGRRGNGSNTASALGFTLLRIARFPDIAGHGSAAADDLDPIGCLQGISAQSAFCENCLRIHFN